MGPLESLKMISEVKYNATKLFYPSKLLIQKTSIEGFINCSRTPAFHQRLPNIFFETTSVSTWYRVDHAKKMRR